MTAAQRLHHPLAAPATEAAGILRALSNPSRLLIMCHLAEGEMTVGEIEAALGLGQAYVSQQLARLREERLVTATRTGRQMRYRLADHRIAPVIGVLYEQFCAPAVMGDGAAHGRGNGAGAELDDGSERAWAADGGAEEPSTGPVAPARLRSPR